MGGDPRTTQLKQYLGMQANQCNYTCAHVCLSHLSPIQSLKGSPAITCISQQCQCVGAEAPELEPEDEELWRQIQIEMGPAKLPQDSGYVQQPRPIGYDLYLNCDHQCGKDCFKAFKEQFPWEVIDICLKDRCNCFFNNNTVQPQQQQSELQGGATFEPPVILPAQRDEPEIIRERPHTRRPHAARQAMVDRPAKQCDKLCAYRRCVNNPSLKSKLAVKGCFEDCGCQVRVQTVSDPEVDGSMALFSTGGANEFGNQQSCK